MFVNENGQTYFSTAIYEAAGCDEQHWLHRGVALFSANVKTYDATNAEATLSQDTYDYDGSAHTPAVSVEIGGITLVENTNFVVVYSNNTGANTASATVNFIGEYAGNTAITKNFTIAPITVSNAVITLSQETYEYSGNANTPAVTVEFNNTTLTQDVDYTVAYSNNINLGTATATITYIGNYTGVGTKDFTIGPINASSAVVALSQSTYEYSGNANTPSVTVTIGNTPLTQDTDYTIAYSNNIEIGTATVTVTYIGNYAGNTAATKDFTIVGIDTSSAVITLEKNSYEYKQNTQPTPAVTIKLGDKTLVKDTDYTVAYTDNDKIGTATVTITYIGDYAGNANAVKTFTITQPPSGACGGLIGTSNIILGLGLLVGTAFVLKKKRK